MNNNFSCLGDQENRTKLSRKKKIQFLHKTREHFIFHSDLNRYVQTHYEHAVRISNLLEVYKYH